MLRIPLYAERLLQGLDDLDWPAGVKDMQRNWIGRSTGAEVDFALDGLDFSLRVYTTRPDTLFGATYMVIAPEHPEIQKIITPEQKALVDEYRNQAAKKSDLDRTELAKEKTGVFSGRYAKNPVNGALLPIWVADYVLMGYGTGAIMAVPAHDTRDWEFAKKFNLPIIEVLKSEVDVQQQAWTEDGIHVNSEFLDGLNKKDAIAKIIEWLDKENVGKATVNYKIRDWLFSRQRYWGEPFPVIHWEDGEVSMVDEKELPHRLPELTKYEPSSTGESPLANATEWLNVVDKNGRKGRYETNTMPQWAGSCWYYLRYTDPTNNDAPFSVEAENYWMPVDLYIGGAEHAVLHLLYSRFWHKVLFDLGIVSTDEPYKKLYNQGMILAFAYETQAGAKVTSDMVEERDGKYIHKETGEELRQIVAKMSKSLKNVVNPDDVIARYGADSLRLYEMFMGPLDAVKPWAESGVKGVFNFLSRVCRFFTEKENVVDRYADDKAVLKEFHKTVKKVADDVESLRFNTAISQMMVFSNACYKAGKISTETARGFVKVLAPFAPHLAEELWQMYGGAESLSYEPWPEYDASILVDDTVVYPVSFNGKRRFEVEFPKDAQPATVEKMVLEDERAQKWLEGNQPKKVIVVPGKIINIVI